VTEHADTGHASVEPTEASVALTGLPEVDSVLESLHSLSELPVEQHVAVFEAAHAGLRDALNSATVAAEPISG
jgi:hypothetical protein